MTPANFWFLGFGASVGFGACVALVPVGFSADGFGACVASVPRSEWLQCLGMACDSCKFLIWGLRCQLASGFINGNDKTRIHEDHNVSSHVPVPQSVFTMSLLLMSVRLPLQHPQQQRHLPGVRNVQDC